MSSSIVLFHSQIKTKIDSSFGLCEELSLDSISVLKHRDDELFFFKTFPYKYIRKVRVRQTVAKSDTDLRFSPLRRRHQIM
jgi:hypothetical protein